MSWLTGQAWKIATGGAVVITLLLSALLMASYFQNRDLSSARAELARRIDDPKTGYVVQLAQARTNEATLKAVVTRQNAAYATLSATSRAQLAQSERALALAQARTREMEVRLRSFLATKPRGSTLEERVRDIDDRALAELIK